MTNPSRINERRAIGQVEQEQLAHELPPTFGAEQLGRISMIASPATEESQTTGRAFTENLSEEIQFLTLQTLCCEVNHGNVKSFSF